MGIAEPVGVVSSPCTELAVEPTVLFLDLIVTLEGMLGVAATPFKEARGEARGGVCVGAGSLDLAE